MNDEASEGLRQLAREYYDGKRSFESYRHERTQLLDRLTAQADDDKTIALDAGVVSGKTRAMQTAVRKPTSSAHRYHRIWMFIMVLMIIFFLIWAVNSGWIALSLGQLESEGAATSVVGSGEKTQ